MTETTRDVHDCADLLEVVDLRIASQIGDRTRAITSGVNLRIRAGETLGIVGESGSGKSITARAIMGILPTGVSAQGQIRYRGRDLLELSERALAAVRGREISMVFQDPFTMLNPLMRCGEQVAELVRDDAGRRLSRRARRTHALAQLHEVGITDPDVVDAYPFQLSGGMRQRVGIAAALAQDPQLIIADEPSTALDVATQREVLSRLSEIQESRGMGLILITHDLRVAFSICDRIAVLYAGSVLEHSPATELTVEQHHPYTLGLLLSEPPGDRRLDRLAAIPGSVPQPDDVAGRCTFADRCSWAQDVCVDSAPALTESGPGRESACVRWPDIAPHMAATRTQGADGLSMAGRSGDGSPLVVVDHLDKTFASRGGRTVQAVRGVSIEISANESVGIVGESGSGKTTLGRCLLGLERPTSGRIVIDGVDASNYDRLDRAQRQQLRRTVQMIFQDPYSTLNPARTIGATLQEALNVAKRHGSGSALNISELLDLVGLPAGYAARKPVALSGGERQRVGVARALAAKPKLIVCDEAVSALDVSVQAQILNLLGSIRDEMGVSYLFITHDLAVVRQIADRVYVLKNGEVVEQGLTDDILDRPDHPYTRSLIGSTPRSDPKWLERAPRT